MRDLQAKRRADEQTRTAYLLITSDPSGVAGGCTGLQILQKDKDLSVRVGGFVSSTSAVGYPKASSSALACYKFRVPQVA
jgi:hypothetical protein